MTEYDYSPEAARRFAKNQNRVSDWVSETAKAQKYHDPLADHSPSLSSSDHSSSTVRPVNSRSHTHPHGQYIRPRGFSGPPDQDIRSRSITPPHHHHSHSHPHHHPHAPIYAQPQPPIRPRSHSHHHSSDLHSDSSRSHSRHTGHPSPRRSNTVPVAFTPHGEPLYRMVDPRTGQEVILPHPYPGPLMVAEPQSYVVLPPDYHVVSPGHHSSHSHRHHPRHESHTQQPLLKRLLTSITGSKSRDSSALRTRRNSSTRHHSRRQSY